MFRTSKNTSIYTNFGRNRPIETIDDYDGTVHCGPFQKISRPSDLDEGLRSIRTNKRLKTHRLAAVGSRSDTLDPIPCVKSLISVKTRSLNARFYVSNKFILNSSNLIFKLGQWQVEVESTGRKVKRLKSEDSF